MTTIRVLRVHNRFVIGGPLTHIAELSCGLPSNYQTLLVGGSAEPHEQDVSNYLQSLGIDLKIIPALQRSPNVLRDIVAFVELCRIIRTFRPHIVHSHGAKSGFIARLAARFMRVPIVVHTYHGHTFHSYFSAWKERSFLALERFANRKVDAIVTLSPGQKHDLCEVYRVCTPAKSHVIALGFDVQKFISSRDTRRAEFRKMYGMPENQLIVGWIGRMVAVKDPFLFIDVVREAEKQAANFKAVMVGDGPLRAQAEEKARQESLREPVLFTSWVHPPELAIAGMDILVLSSFNEGTPLAILEAQACGIPVVSVEAGGAAETFLPGESGILVNSREPADIAKAVLTLLGNAEQRRVMGIKGREFVLAKHSNKRLIEDIDALYQQLLDLKGIKAG